MLVLQDTDKTAQEMEVMVKVNNIISRMQQDATGKQVKITKKSADCSSSL